MQRRTFLKTLSSFSLAITLPLHTFVSKAKAEAQRILPEAFWKSSPLQIIPANQANSSEFNGDSPDGAHNVLWDLDGYLKRKGGVPPPTEEKDVVIVGGGMAGLCSAYELRNLNYVLLDYNKQFGGNAKAERFGETEYPIGAVYISEPEPGTATHKLLSELNLLSKGRVEHAADTTVFFQNKFARGFWSGTTDENARAQFQEIFQELNSWVKDPEKNKLLSFDASSTESHRLDSITFEKWLKERFGTIHPRIQEYFQLYGWSSFLTSMDEISAQQMLGFIAAETESIMSFPGGLGAISQSLYAKLLLESPQSLRANCLGVDIRKVGDRVHVCYRDESDNLKTISAKACIFAGPKFVAKRIIRDAPAAQKEAWAKLTYRSYVVGNVILDAPITSPSFELYCLEGEVPPTPTFVHPSQRAFSDICFGSWASFDKGKNSVITVYSGLAYSGAQQYLFSPMAHSKHRERILRGIEPILRALGKSQANVLGIRLTRLGHPMPVAFAGLLSAGVPQKASEPIQNSIFFANQDNWANPCFETAFQEARLAAQKIRERI